MRILLDQGIFDMRNAGQNALLQVAVERVGRLWPDASIEITTLAPILLKIYFPHATPVHPGGQYHSLDKESRFKKILNRMPVLLVKLLLESREEIWHISSRIKSIRKGFSDKIEFPESNSERTEVNDRIQGGKDKSAVEYDYRRVVEGYDLVIATGSQYLTDIARDAGMAVLDRLDAAIRLGIPTFLVGQGIGPVKDAELFRKAKQVLPNVKMIFVREKIFAPDFLQSIGVDPARIFMTGDDAIELVYRERKKKLGSGIGLSLRMTSYTEVGNKDIQIIGEVLKQKAGQYNAKVVSLPISRSLHERDDRLIRQLVSGYRNIWLPKSKFPLPSEIIKDAQQCRIVISGTFHGAAFALGQGIPVICLAKGASYVLKLKGLADLFGPGCVVIDMNDENLEEVLDSAIDNVWVNADQLKDSLLERAAQQIEWGRSAYQKLFDFVENQ
jgi:polysaccharide pyruvyl transferase WcaK-like protein